MAGSVSEKAVPFSVLRLWFGILLLGKNSQKVLKIIMHLIFSPFDF